MRDIDIGEVVRRTGIRASALRFYEAQGLIHSHGRRGLRRQYPGGVLERLALVALGQAAGFSLQEIGSLLGEGPRPSIDRRFLAAKAHELDGTIRRLLAMRKGLRHAARCPAANHLDCPTFRGLMRAALARPTPGKTLPPAGRARRPHGAGGAGPRPRGR